MSRQWGDLHPERQRGALALWECGRNYDSVGGKELSSVSTGTNPGNHTLTHIPAVAATCIRSGNLEYWHCSACGQNLNAAGAVLASVTLPVDPDNHNLVRHDGKAATCTEAGYAAYDACTRCGYTPAPRSRRWDTATARPRSAGRRRGTAAP